MTRIATALDPRIKSYLPALYLDQKSIERELKWEFETYYQSRFLEESAQAVKISASTSNNPSSSATSSVMLSLMQVLQAPNVQSTSQESFESELKRWFAHQPMSMEQSSRDVCMWFKVNKSIYPRIEMKARDYMGVTSTSVPSEVAFSRAGVTVSKRRARLDDDAVTAICELQSFLQFNKQ